MKRTSWEQSHIGIVKEKTTKGYTVEFDGEAHVYEVSPDEVSSVTSEAVQLRIWALKVPLYIAAKALMDVYKDLFINLPAYGYRVVEEQHKKNVANWTKADALQKYLTPKLKQQIFSRF